MSQPNESSKSVEKDSSKLKLVKTDDCKPDGYEGGCLRPLGLCDLGGACDVCWYGSANNQTRKSKLKP